MKPVTLDDKPLVPGYNVDRIDRRRGVQEAVTCGYSTLHERWIVDYALSRWAKGEEDLAQRTMLSHGIDLTSVYRIVAAARMAAEQEVAHEQSGDLGTPVA